MGHFSWWINGCVCMNWSGYCRKLCLNYLTVLISSYWFINSWQVYLHQTLSSWKHNKPWKTCQKHMDLDNSDEKIVAVQSEASGVSRLQTQRMQHWPHRKVSWNRYNVSPVSKHPTYCNIVLTESENVDVTPVADWPTLLHTGGSQETRKGCPERTTCRHPN